MRPVLPLATRRPYALLESDHETILSNRDRAADPSLQRKAGEGLMRALARVPAIFFDRTFDIADPRVLQQVLLEAIRADAAARPAATAADAAEPAPHLPTLQHMLDTSAGRSQLHEVLSGFLDEVESDLLFEVGIRSEQILGAAGKLREVHSALDYAMEDVGEARGRVRDRVPFLVYYSCLFRSLLHFSYFLRLSQRISTFYIVLHCCSRKV